MVFIIFYVLNVRSEKNNTKYSSVLLLSLVLFFSERTLSMYELKKNKLHIGLKRE